MKNNNWVRGAMLLAVGLVLQALRLVIPMPPMWTVFVVGTLVNMVLVLAARTVGLWPSVMIAVLLPVMAYFQGQLPLPFLIPVVAVGNLVMVYLCARFWGKGIIIAAPLFKTFIYIAAVCSFCGWLQYLKSWRYSFCLLWAGRR